MRLPLRLLTAGALAAGLLTGCAGPAPDVDSAAAPEPSRAAGHSGHGSATALWAVQTAPLGVVATDGVGRLLYRSDADSAAPSVSRCVDACTEEWQPVLLPAGQEAELLGVQRTAVGQVVRPDGSVQVTLAGWPLYYNTTDKPGLNDTGHNGQNGWSVVTPTGEKAGAA